MGVTIIGLVIDIIMFVILLPFVVLFIANVENLTPTQTTLLALVTLFLVLGFVFSVIKDSGLMKK